VLSCVAPYDQALGRYTRRRGEWHARRVLDRWQQERSERAGAA
jgi:hypothetical protein